MRCGTGNFLPKISVIALCFEHEKFLEEALLSVFSQDYPDFEVIICDDGSSDNSSTIIADLIKDKINVIFIQNEQNEGICRAFNRAFKYSSGEFIIDFACDDVMLPHRLRRQADFFLQQKSSVGAIYAELALIDEKSIRTGQYYSTERKKMHEKFYSDSYALSLAPGGLIAVPALMYRREVFEKCGLYDENLDYEDYDFLTRCGKIYAFAKQSGVHTLYRKSTHSLSNKFKKRGKNSMLVSTAKILKKQDFLKMNDLQKKAFLLSLRYHFKEAIFLQCREAAAVFSEIIQTAPRCGVFLTILQKIYRAAKMLRIV
jgi:glycosyltransferase involved in cell wall biosynthesis